MKGVLLLFGVLMCSAIASAQSSAPVFLGQGTPMLAPAVDGSGKAVAFGSAITPDGGNLGTTELWTAAADGTGLQRLTHLANLKLTQPKGANAVSLSANAARVAYTVVGPTSPSTTPPVTSGQVEEVHVVDVSSGADHVAVVDTGGCIMPLATPICIGCFFTCVNMPHITDDGSKVLYSVSRNQPLYSVNSDGTGLIHLPIYTGALAPAPRRVISRAGVIAFTSSAPFGPTVAASATDVYEANLDGTNVRNVTKFGNASMFAANAVISADGGSIAFELTQYPSSGVVSSSNVPVTQIWRANVDGSALRAVTDAADSSFGPSVSGDGSFITFLRGGQAYIVRADGTGLKALTNFQMSAVGNVVISDDGSLVVFTIGPRDGGIGAIYAVNSDGSNLHAVYAPRVLNQNGVTGAMQGTSLAPGALFSAYGMNLGPDSITAAQSYPLPESLAGVSLRVNGRAAPLAAVTPWQVNAQLPSDIGAGPANFQFGFADGSSSAAVAADVASAAPAIFIIAPQSQNCSGGVCVSQPPQAAAFHTNTGIPADQTHPAAAGEVLEFYGTGLGATVPAVAAGVRAPGPPPAQTVAVPEVLIGNVSAQVTFAGLTPGFAGVYQVNAVVPAGVRSGFQMVQWRVGGATSNGGTITVK